MGAKELEEEKLIEDSIEIIKYYKSFELKLKDRLRKEGLETDIGNPLHFLNTFYTYIAAKRATDSVDRLMTRLERGPNLASVIATSLLTVVSSLLSGFCLLTGSTQLGLIFLIPVFTGMASTYWLVSRSLK